MLISNNKHISHFHFVTHNEIHGRKPFEQAELACNQGAHWISLRTRHLTYKELYPLAEKTQAVCKAYGAKFIINNNVILAKELDADGVHLGPLDIPIDQARSFLGYDKIIGVSVNSFEEIKRAVTLGADYIALGPTRFNKSKELKSPIITPAKFLTIKRRCIEEGINIPLIATGGVSPDDFEIFMDLGLDGIAVSANKASDFKAEQTAEFVKKLEKVR